MMVGGSWFTSLVRYLVKSIRRMAFCEILVLRDALPNLLPTTTWETFIVPGRFVTLNGIRFFFNQGSDRVL